MSAKQEREINALLRSRQQTERALRHERDLKHEMLSLSRAGRHDQVQAMLEQYLREIGELGRE